MQLINDLAQQKLPPSTRRQDSAIGEYDLNQVPGKRAPKAWMEGYSHAVSSFERSPSPSTLGQNACSARLDQPLSARAFAVHTVNSDCDVRIRPDEFRHGALHGRFLFYVIEQPP